MSETDQATPPSPTKRGISRREVMVASAWAAPVVAVAMAAPTAAASGHRGTSVILFDCFTADKHSGAVRSTFSLKYPRLVNPAGVSLASVVVTLDFSKRDFTGDFSFTGGSGWSGPAAATSDSIAWHLKFTYTGVVTQGNSTPVVPPIDLVVKSGARGASLLAVTAVGVDSAGKATLPTADVATVRL